MIFEKIQSILSEQLGIPAEDIELNTNIMEDLGADSLDIVEMIMALEDEFGLEIADEEAAELSTVGKIIEYVEANI